MSSIRPWRDIERRTTRKIMVGSVPVGGDSPISVQSMTNTPTTDVQATIAQIRSLEDAGADIVRVSCPDEESTANFEQIVKAVSGPLVSIFLGPRPAPNAITMRGVKKKKNKKKIYIYIYMQSK